MFIQTEATPNPATLKFLPGESVMESGTANFATRDDAASSPLAMRLYEIEGVTGVFFGGDFITVTKSDDQDWSFLKSPILGAIMEHFTAGAPLFTDDSAISVHADSGEDDELVTKIKELLETRIRPAVAQDGGDILFHGFQRGVVYLRMQGSCSGCPSSTATLKVGIENLLRHHIPEVIEVRAV
ncbi:MAG: NifU family protein [Alphaproteobacteria bacterium]|nr:NifU family protein [Alphaproteobacteria bacterium]